MTSPAEIAHGPMLIGFSINVLLLGIMTTQVYLYYTHYKEDRFWIKTFVAVLFLLNIANTALILVYLYQSVIIHFGDPMYLTVVTWVFGVADPMLTGFITMSVQVFFAWRIYVLTRKWFYLVLIIIPALMGGTAAFATPFIVIKHPRFIDMQLAAIPDTIWLGAGVVADILITGVLRNHKTGIRRSDMMVDRIIRLTVQTGLITVVVAVIDIVFFLTNTGGIHIMFTFTLSKLYSTSLMSSLNARRGWDNVVHNPGLSVGYGDNGIISVGHISRQPQGHGSRGNTKSDSSVQFGSSTGQFEVRVDVESHQTSDLPDHEEDDPMGIERKGIRLDRLR